MGPSPVAYTANGTPSQFEFVAFAISVSECLDFEREAAEIVALWVNLLAGERVGVRRQARRQGWAAAIETTAH